MRSMIASDIHGSALWCERLLTAFHREEADRLILLGDLLYHGPRNDLPEGYDPKAVIRLLSPMAGKLLCVRGNCDTEVDQMVLPFPVLADYGLLSLGKRLVYLTHGHHFNDRALPPLCPGDVLIFGHTHVPMCREQDGILCLNPGSVSLPKKGSHHGYMLLDSGLFLWKDMDGREVMRHELGGDPA